MTAEAAGALVIVVTTGLLTGLNPEPTEPQAPSAPASISASGSDFATTTKVALTATPGLAGPNDFRADATDFDTGEPVVATGVRLRFEPVGRSQVTFSELDLIQTGSGAWTGNGAQLSLAGVWNVTAQVQAGASTTEAPLVLTTRPPGRSTGQRRVAGGPARHRDHHPCRWATAPVLPRSGDGWSQRRPCHGFRRPRR